MFADLAWNKAKAEAQVEQLKAEAQKTQADLQAKANHLTKAGQASWAALSGALDESRNAFSRAIEVTAKRSDEAANMRPEAFASTPFAQGPLKLPWLRTCWPRNQRP
jgi:hypothetical protein